jgi:hypothetical protein
MVDRTQGDPIDDRGRAGMAVLDNVRRQKQRSLSQLTDSAAGRLSTQDRRAESGLAQSEQCLPRRITTDILIRYKPRGRHIGDRKASLHLNQTRHAIHGHHEDGRDDRILSRRDPTEVDQRYTKVMRGE